MSVTVPPLRTLAIEAAMVSCRPTASRTRSTPLTLGLTEDLLHQVVTGKQQCFVGADAFGRFQAGGIDIRHQHFGGSCGLRCLKRQQADHARADDESRLAALHL